jgi:hypothetical protein
MPTPSMRIPASQVPVAARRRAAQHLEAVRDTEMGVRARRARLGDQVLPIYRPDLEDPAYYEFEVELGTTSGPSKGFIVVSAGRHDYPVPHWSFDAEPVGRRLETAARSAAPARVYKVDALSYVAENAAGEKVGQVGQLALPLDGLPADLEPLRGQITTAVAAPTVRTADDNGAADVRHTRTVVGPAASAVRTRKATWRELRAAYATSLRPLLDELAKRAADAWSIDDLVARYGEGVMVGRPHRVALLEPTASAKLGGDAASVVQMKRLERPGTPPVLELSASTFPFEHEAEFTLTISYGSGAGETLPFFLVAPDTKSSRRTAKEG